MESLIFLWGFLFWFCFCLKLGNAVLVTVLWVRKLGGVWSGWRVPYHGGSSCTCLVPGYRMASHSSFRWSLTLQGFSMQLRILTEGQAQVARLPTRRLWDLALRTGNESCRSPKSWACQSVHYPFLLILLVKQSQNPLGFHSRGHRPHLLRGAVAKNLQSSLIYCTHWEGIDFQPPQSLTTVCVSLFQHPFPKAMRTARFSFCLVGRRVLGKEDIQKGRGISISVSMCDSSTKQNHRVVTKKKNHIII